MRLSSLDIARQDFALAFRGYNRAEVDEFLAKLQTDYEQLVKENNSLKAEVSALSQRLDEFRAMEENLKGSLLLAQKVAEEKKANAQKEAELIISQAHLQARQIQEDARAQLEEIRTQYARLRGEMRSLLNLFSEVLMRFEREGDGGAPSRSS